MLFVWEYKFDVFGGFRAYAWSVGVMDSELLWPPVVPISYQVGAVVASLTSSLPWLRGTEWILSDHQNRPAGAANAPFSRLLERRPRIRAQH